jgi:hypothetical protein
MKPILAKLKVFFFRGWSYAQLPAIGISAAYALETKFGIPFLWSAVIGVLLCVIVGSVDYSHGIAKNENDLSWELAPKANKLCNDMEEVNAKLDTLIQKQM